MVSRISSSEATLLLFVGDNKGRVYMNKEKLPRNFMYWEIFPEGGRPGQMLEVSISILFYEIRRVELQGQVEAGFIYENAPVTAVIFLKNIKNTLWITTVKELATHKKHTGEKTEKETCISVYSRTIYRRAKESGTNPIWWCLGCKWRGTSNKKGSNINGKSYNRPVLLPFSSKPCDTWSMACAYRKFPANTFIRMIWVTKTNTSADICSKMDI